MQFMFAEMERDRPYRVVVTVPRDRYVGDRLIARHFRSATYTAGIVYATDGDEAMRIAETRGLVPESAEVVTAHQVSLAEALSGRCAGFTLVEMLASIAVIAMLLAIAAPALAAARSAAREAACRSNLHQQAIATQAYAADHRAMPETAAAHDLPSGAQRCAADSTSQPSYHYVAPLAFHDYRRNPPRPITAAAALVLNFDTNGQIPVWIERERMHDRRERLYSDFLGRVRRTGVRP